MRQQEPEHHLAEFRRTFGVGQVYRLQQPPLRAGHPSGGVAGEKTKDLIRNSKAFCIARRGTVEDDYQSC
ncbi:hypothetical protein OII53_16815 [Achromobacter ruhlandii]|uniref:hypothetical protein n=1 Tax=Achromobacter ruhlandii TaxID=72557 RepID=UPI0021F1F8F7|nr:hypothetical protein [Achromobacter ruhlandii]MCV6797097.1 hypothetical protein [Achromobacter ruhlandii]MCV6809592.1 hypothetical protein [Achromobacter ruhlandii]MCV6820208.1 hypothetical protein [Achromobacter ruhlandii]